MNVYNVRNVNEALPLILADILRDGVRRSSRNGDVIAFDEPVCIKYRHPTERVVFWPERDANPFFHLMESLWMIGGRNDVEYVARFAKQMREYTDDGKTFHGAYGYRWRHWFDVDQLSLIVAGLINNPNDRRQVLMMWDPEYDLGYKGKDVPCNICATFQINSSGALNMVVFNRSNDLIWGALGANAVHFSFLQEYLASWMKIPVGSYWQTTSNLHVYDNDILKKVRPLADAEPDPWRRSVLNHSIFNPYKSAPMKPFPILQKNEHLTDWNTDLQGFFRKPIGNFFATRFFAEVASPMYEAHALYKEGDRKEALDVLSNVPAEDWKKAAIEWIMRRLPKPSSGSTSTSE